MHDKYGLAATHQCHESVKLGFPEKEKRKTQLRAHEAKYKNNKNKWTPETRQKETLSRQVKQAKGEIKMNTAGDGSPPGNSVFSPVTSVLQSGSSFYPNRTAGQHPQDKHGPGLPRMSASLCPTGSRGSLRTPTPGTGLHQRTTERTDSWPSSIDNILENCRNTESASAAEGLAHLCSSL